MEQAEKEQQISEVLKKLNEILEETNWAMLFPNTDDTVTFIEAKA